jgi:hypothetical protein
MQHAHIYGVSITAASRSHLSLPTARHISLRLFLLLPLISFTASAAHEMSAHAQIMSAYLTEPATANGPTREWLEHTTNRSRSSTKLTVLASTGKNPEQTHRRNF